MTSRKAVPSPTCPWKIEFTVDAQASGLLLCIHSGDQTVLTVSQGDAGISAVIHTVWMCETARFGKDPALDFTLTCPRRGGAVRLSWHGFSFRLYVDDVLQDEDWPLGEPAAGIWHAQMDDAIQNFSVAPSETAIQDPERIYPKPFQNFVLPGHNTGAGDCMPFARDGRYCLYYLLDRRGHASKKGLGAHQWAQVSSADLKEWTLHPMAIGITEQWEGSICTGSLIQKDGKTYAFYAVRMSDGSPARLTYAVSDDGVHFEKSHENFVLTAPYEPSSARDPMVFLDETGLYHMLVTTSLVDVKRCGGCLAHLTSHDLRQWIQQSPFLTPGYADQPECSDYFFWNGWYYLSFSNFATARYRMSRHPFGPWLRPEVDELDASDIHVPKTAAFGNRRFSTGTLPYCHQGFGGYAVTHELYQREDGTLGAKHLEEILPPAYSASCPKDAKIKGGQGRAELRLPAAEAGFRLKATLRPETKGMLMGLAILVDENEYRIEMNPAAKTVSIIRPEENFSYGSARNMLRCVTLTPEVRVDVILHGNVLDLALGDGRMMTMCLAHSAENGAYAALFAIAGTLSAAEMELSVF